MSESAAKRAYSEVGGNVEPIVATRFEFNVGDQPGMLDQCLKVFATHHLDLKKIESNVGNISGAFVINADINTSSNTDANAVVKALIALQKIQGTNARVVSSVKNQISWFPRTIYDLDSFACKVMTYGEELDADHPGFKDEVYRRRRLEIVSLAQKFRTGDKLPYIEYTDEEKATWKVCYTGLKKAYEKHACKEHKNLFPILEQKGLYGPDIIPQLEPVSRFLQGMTGWRLRPVMGLLSPRDFLNGLAFRVFHSTQYIRHSSKPMYTPEPDVCHELMGHVPMFANKEFSRFSQEIGLASLGATDDEINKLATVYWFTVEFGLCKEGDQLKAFGAGLLSSFGELEYACTSDKCERVPFNPFVACETEYPITKFQPKYFVATSFENATKLVKEFACTLKRPFQIAYDPYTQSMHILNDKEYLAQYTTDLSSQMQLVAQTLKQMKDN